MCALIQRQRGSWYAEQATLAVHDAHSVSSENPIEPCEVPYATQNCPRAIALETLDYSCPRAVLDRNSPWIAYRHHGSPSKSLTWADRRMAWHNLDSAPGQWRQLRNDVPTFPAAGAFPSRKPGVAGDVGFGTDNVSAIGLEAPLGRGSWAHVHADLDLCRDPGIPTRLGHRGPPKMSLLLLLPHLQP